MRIYVIRLLITSLFLLASLGLNAKTKILISNCKTDTLKAREWLNRVDAYSDAAQYDSAANCYEKAARIYRKLKNWEQYIFCRNGIFVELRNKHDNTDFMPMVNENLSLAKKYLTSETPVLGNSYMNVGHVYADRHTIDSALWYFGKGLEIWKLCYGEGHILLAKVYGNFGMLLHEDNQDREAEEFYKRALEIRINKLGPEHPDVANSYNGLGSLAYSQGKIDECGDYFRKAIQIREAYYGEDHPVTAESYNNYAALCFMREDYQQALFYNYKALDVRLKTLGPMNPDVALSYNNLANIYSSIGDYDKSDEFHQRALNLRLELWGDTHMDVAQSYQNIGVNNFERGEYRESLSNAKEVLRILEVIYGKDHPNLHDAYNNIGAAYHGLGDYDKAFYYLYKGLEMRQEISPDNPALAVSYNNIGAMCKFRGDYDLARSYYLKDLELINKLYDYNTLDLASAYNNLGEIFFIQKDYSTALDYFNKSRDIHASLHGLSHPDVVSSFINICSVYSELDSLDRELELIDEGLKTMLASFGEKHPRTCKLYTLRAMNLAKRGEYEEAIEIQRKVLQIMNSMHEPPHPELAKAYKHLGTIYAESERPDSAFHYFNLALQINYYGELPENSAFFEITNMLDELDFLEALAKKAGIEYKLYQSSKNSEMLRQSLSSFYAATRLAATIRENFTLPDSKIILLNDMADIYAKAVTVSLELGRIDNGYSPTEASFAFSEMNKGATLLETMRQCRINNYRYLPDSILEEEKELHQQIQYFKSKITELQDMKTDSMNRQLEYFNSKYANTVLELNTLRKKLSDFSLGQGSSVTDSIPDSKDIQCRLSDKAVMIEYLLGDSTFFIFILGTDFQEVIEVPDVQKLNELIPEHLANIKKFKPEQYAETAHTLYKILIEPVKSYLSGKEKILIIPDKILLYLPFETLVSEISGKEKNDSLAWHCLLYDFEISYHYSASLWIEINRREQEMQEGFLGFAPVFPGKNSGSVVSGTTENLLSTILDENVRSSVSKDGYQLNELPFTMEEVIAISGLFGSKNLTADSYLFDLATESNFKEHCGNYNYIHLATHGLVNTDKPDLSGLVFTGRNLQDSITERNNRDLTFTMNVGLNDGVLFVHEIYDLQLHADLVVLSACETGMGKLEKGEGVMSLNRGFLYAGAQNIVFSYWKVNDKYTSWLMTWFYKYIIEGYNYSKALQLAKLKLLEKEESAYPLYWAGFAIIGD